jgi:RHS repeat-associated protein
VHAEEDLPSLTSGAEHVFLEMMDHLGSTAIVIDRDTGELVEAGTYQPYGATETDYRPERWRSFREDYRFTGKEEDVELGLQYFGKRYLVPSLGRWASADPETVHGFGADANAYAYVHARLLAATDPMGLEDGATWWDMTKVALRILFEPSPMSSIGQQYARSRLRDSIEHPEHRMENMRRTNDEIRYSLAPGDANPRLPPGAHSGPCGSGCACSVRAHTEAGGPSPPAHFAEGRGPNETPSPQKVAAQEALQQKLPVINGQRAIIPSVKRALWDPMKRILKFEPGSRAAEIAPEGVQYDEAGNPNVEPFQKAEVKIDNFSADRSANMNAANAKMREVDPNWVQPEGTTWHEERSIAGNVMRLLDTVLHQEIPHTGGVAEKVGEAAGTNGGGG